MSSDGILNIDKPAGLTSFQVVALVRRLSGQRRVGHGGTLDPLARGVLPVALGQGTRVLEFLGEATKTYRAQIRLGVTTDTYDAEGRIIEERDASAIGRELAEAALASFRGTIQQRPPPYSALKEGGQRLYHWARAGVEVRRPPRPIHVLRLEMVAWQPPLLTVEVECGKGTYLRSLAHDLGQVLGCGAHLHELIRLRNGPFTIDDGLSLSELEDAFGGGYWREFLYPLDFVLLHHPAAILGREKSAAVLAGRQVALREAGPETCRGYSWEGDFVAILRYRPEAGLWHPDKVFRSEARPPGQA